MVAPSDGGEDDDDIGALIYRESQLRKAEAAAAAAQSKKTSSASSHNNLAGREHLSTTRAKNHCLVRNANVLRGEQNESLHWRRIGPGKR